MSNDEGNLVQRRSRRTTAGNRMAQALAEMELDMGPVDLDEDDDFINKEEEEDRFESDFASTDEDVAPEAENSEVVILNAEKQMKRIHLLKHRAKIQKAPILPPLRSKAMSIKESFASNRLPANNNRQRGDRKSNRDSTVRNSKLLNTRLKDAADRQTLPFKPRRAQQDGYKSQIELIQLALDMEDSNLKSHQTYLKTEEERRRKAAIIERPVVAGPYTSWTSKCTKVKREKELRAQQETNNWLSKFPYGYYAQYAQYGQYQPARVTEGNSHRSRDSSLPWKTTSSTFSSKTTAKAAGAAIGIKQMPLQISRSTENGSSFSPLVSQLHQNSQYPRTLASTPKIPPPYYYSPSTVFPISTQSNNAEEWHCQEQNFLLLELGGVDTNIHQLSATVRNRKIEKQRRAVPWHSEMAAMFGDHTQWDEVKVLNSRSRSLGGRRTFDICAISGRKAVYRDPLTGIPYANVDAFQTIRKLMRHSYLWDDNLACYVGE